VLALSSPALAGDGLSAETQRLWAQARSLIEQGLQTAALQPLKRAVQLSPSAIAIHCDYQDLMMAQGFAVDLIEEYESRRDREPTQADWHYLYGRATGDPQLASAAFTQALGLDSEHKWARQGLGGVAAVKGELDEALDHYRVATELDPGFALAHNKIAGIHYARGQFAEAKQAWRAAIAAAPSDYHAYLNMGAVFSMEGDLEGAADLLGQSVAKAPGNPLAYVNLGYVLFKLRRYDLALANFSAALAINPRDRKVAGSVRLVESVRAGTMPFEAFAPYEKALGAGPRNPKKAVQHFAEVILLAPEFATAHSHLGMARLSLGEVEEGLSSLRKAVALEPTSPGLLFNLGYALMGTEDFGAALLQLKKAHGSDPGDLDILSSLALCQLALGLSQEAIRSFGRALDIQPRDPVLWLQLGSAQASAGDLVAAAQSAQRSLTIAPGFSAARMQLVTILQEDRRFSEALVALRPLEEAAPDHSDLASLRSAIENARAAHEATASKSGNLRLSRIFVTSESRAHKVSQRLAGGSSFEAMARAFGEGDEKARSGDIGYLAPSSLRSELSGPVRGLKVGQWVGPIALGKAWVFLKRTD
jgi:tetratricopeptide (TPR) repeat protein